MKVRTFISSYNGNRVHFIDYNFNASIREKKRLFDNIKSLSLYDYFKSKRPDIIEDMESVINTK